MSGTIGITPAGTKLDIEIEKLSKQTKRRIVNFITKVTSIRREIEDSGISYHLEFILGCIKNEFLSHIEEKYKGVVSDYMCDLMQNYVTTLTRPSFSFEDARVKLIAYKKSTSAIS